MKVGSKKRWSEGWMFSEYYEGGQRRDGAKDGYNVDPGRVKL